MYADAMPTSSSLGAVPQAREVVVQGVRDWGTGSAVEVMDTSTRTVWTVFPQHGAIQDQLRGVAPGTKGTLTAEWRGPDGAQQLGYEAWNPSSWAANAKPGPVSDTRSGTLIRNTDGSVAVLAIGPVAGADKQRLKYSVGGAGAGALAALIPDGIEQVPVSVTGVWTDSLEVTGNAVSVQSSQQTGPAIKTPAPYQGGSTVYVPITIQPEGVLADGTINPKAFTPEDMQGAADLIHSTAAARGTSPEEVYAQVVGHLEQQGADPGQIQQYGAQLAEAAGIAPGGALPSWAPWLLGGLALWGVTRRRRR